ncbi:hypothetical protein C9J85_04165 [Haloferax sp. wsp5]|nr:hypothetical protein C9J85_04165 [Haloferax sp. wsp5]
MGISPYDEPILIRAPRVSNEPPISLLSPDFGRLSDPRTTLTGEQQLSVLLYLLSTLGIGSKTHRKAFVRGFNDDAGFSN